MRQMRQNFIKPSPQGLPKATLRTIISKGNWISQPVNVLKYLFGNSVVFNQFLITKLAGYHSQNDDPAQGRMQQTLRGRKMGF